MNSKPIEIYHPLTVSHLGLWDMASLQFKIYGLVADNRSIDQAMLSLAQSLSKPRFCRVWQTRR